jgi:hypothetical protein
MQGSKSQPTSLSEMTVAVAANAAAAEVLAVAVIGVVVVVQVALTPLSAVEELVEMIEIVVVVAGWLALVAWNFEVAAANLVPPFVAGESTEAVGRVADIDIVAVALVNVADNQDVVYTAVAG